LIEQVCPGRDRPGHTGAVTAPPERPQSAERLVMFTDAVAAIALTLLILPLLEVISDARAQRLPFAELMDDHLGEFGAFVLSFAVIFRSAYAPSPGTVGLYGGTLVLATGSIAMLARSAYRHPELAGGRPPATRDEVLGSTTILIAQVLATIVGCVFPERINFWAFTLMFLVGPAERLVRARWAASEL